MASIQELSKSVDGLLSGSALIHDILQYNPKSLTICGIDGYKLSESQWDWDKHYIDNYLPEKTLKQATELKKQGKLIPHNLDSNNVYLISLYKQGKIQLDDDVLKIYGLYNN